MGLAVAAASNGTNVTITGLRTGGGLGGAGDFVGRNVAWNQWVIYIGASLRCDRRCDTGQKWDKIVMKIPSEEIVVRMMIVVMKNRHSYDEHNYYNSRHNYRP